MTTKLTNAVFILNMIWSTQDHELTKTQIVLPGLELHILLEESGRVAPFGNEILAETIDLVSEYLGELFAGRLDPFEVEFTELLEVEKEHLLKKKEKCYGTKCSGQHRLTTIFSPSNIKVIPQVV